MVEYLHRRFPKSLTGHYSPGHYQKNLNLKLAGHGQEILPASSLRIRDLSMTAVESVFTYHHRTQISFLPLHSVTLVN